MAQARLSENERKRQIIDAAARVAREQGLERLTARAVAAAAGISHGLILHHFGSMEHVQSALLDWLLERVLDPQTDGLEEIPVARRLPAFLERQLTWLDADPRLMDLVFDYWSRGLRDPTTRERIRIRMQAFRESVEPITADLIATDPARFSGTDATALAITVGDLIIGYAIQRQIHPEAAGRHTLLAAIDALLDTA